MDFADFFLKIIPNRDLKLLHFILMLHL